MKTNVLDACNGIPAHNGVTRRTEVKVKHLDEREARARAHFDNGFHHPHLSPPRCFGFNLGNAIKYIWRAGLSASPIEDLKKAAWYLNREIERLGKTP